MTPEDIQWVVFTPAYNPCSGGIVALYRLAKEMKDLGLNVLTTHSTTHPTYDLPFASIEQIAEMPKHNLVAIYPEIIAGNPMGARHVVRWLLNKPGFFGGPKDFGCADILYRYCPAFGGNECGELCVLDFDESQWTDEGREREGECHLFHKGPVSTPPNMFSECIDDFWKTGGANYLRDVLNRKNVFTSYDITTFVSVIAALCGCVSVVKMADGLTAEQWRTERPLLSKGIAYGWDDIERARATLPELRQFIRDTIATGKQQVAAMVQRLTEIVNQRQP